ncbi:MAG: ParB/RepB/Spo0J family partition protein [Verrucomicrobia bacterium]|nr:ParB/RepB/Spo0J family partition protein [Verrucomicrobiota bacterium]
MSKTALGRGLGALLGGAQPSKPAAPPPPSSAPAAAPAENTGLAKLKLESIRPCPLQPRKHFSEDSLAELAASLKENGLIQPLVVRPRGGSYELIAGERRWRAAQQAGFQEVPAWIRDASDREVLEMALVENLQRENLNPVEEAAGFAQLLSQFQLRQEDVAAKVGKSRVHVANTLRLLRLPQEVLAHLRDGRISAGHAKAILALNSAEEQRLACDKIIRDGLTVRAAEDLAQRLSAGAHPDSSRRSGRRGNAAGGGNPHAARLESRLQERFQTRVRLRYRQGKGSIEIQFFSDEDLERVLGAVGLNPE